MAYEHELDEWRSATRRMTERDRHLADAEPRRAAGFIGDKDDARDEAGFDE